MIRPEQLAQALDRLPPRDRELLSLSLRRRVPDEALARVYDCEPSEVARRRARAIERLSDEMELQRGEDLGAVLKALLEPNTWSAAPPAPGEEFSAGAALASAAPSRLAAVPRAAGQESPPAPVLAPVPAPSEPDAAEEKDAAAPADPATADTDSNGAGDPPANGAAEAEANGASKPPGDEAQAGSADRRRTQVMEVAPEPVREMFAAREREVPDPPRRAVPLALVGLAIAALLGAAAVFGLTQLGESESSTQSGGGDGNDGTREFVPESGGPLAAPFPSDPETISCYSTAYARGSTVLYREPGGRRRITLTPKTEWGSPRVLGVVSQRGGWLGVQAPELGNGEIAWMRKSDARLDCARWSMHADLSKRTLIVRQDGKTVRKLRVAVGRSANPTPEGRFTVTDKLKVADPNSAYGCCVLALTGHQTDLPPYWPGGDRLAVHATSDESSIGQPVSLGCLRARAGQVRWLIETIPLGAPIFIRS